MGTFNVVITGRKAKIVVKDRKTRKLVTADDTSPMVVQYQDQRHAMLDAKYLKGLLAANPQAQVEVLGLNHQSEGDKFSLADWLEKCAKDPIPSVRSQYAEIRPQALSEVDALLAEEEAAAKPAEQNAEGNKPDPQVEQKIEAAVVDAPHAAEKKEPPHS